MSEPEQQQPKEYTAMGADLKAIEDFIYSTMNHTREWELAENAYQRILSCSRPHPAPARDIKELFRKEIAKWKDEDPLFMAYVHGQDAGRIEGDRKAREDVLDKVIAWKRKHGYWFTVNQISGEKRYHFEPDRFEGFIKELRITTPQCEQEQPR